MPLIIEIKANCVQPEKIRQILVAHNANFVGIDHQIDTYFKVPNGRLKLREGNIENHLIHYQRTNIAGPKKSEVLLYKSPPGSSLKSVLKAALGILTIVDKKRAIYFIGNVKFHIDEVKNLGSFVEIEAIDEDGTNAESSLEEQCRHFMDLLGIQKKDLLELSYSDLLLVD